MVLILIFPLFFRFFREYESFGSNIDDVVDKAKDQIKRIFTEILAGNIAMAPYQIGSDTGLKYNDYAEIMNFSEELGNHYNVIEGG